MAKYKTHDECKQLFIDLLRQTIASIDHIDEATIWSETEPQWWLDMNDMKTDMIHILRRYKPNTDI